MKKILIATEKPFAAIAVKGMREVIEQAGFELRLLEKYTDKNALLDAVKEVDAIIIRSDIIDNEVFDAAKKLKIIVRAGAGYDNIDVDAATKHHVCVMNTPGQNANAVAELVFGLLVYAKRNFFNGSAGSELLGKKIGIHAFGNVGKNVARIAKGFGLDVYAYDAYCSPETMSEAGVKHVESANMLYNICEIISLHIPATDETKKSINFALLNRMPKGAILINTARKEIIDENSIAQMMEERPDFKYITDIKPDIDAVLSEKYTTRYFATPKKMGAQTAEANVNAGIAAAEQIVDYLLNGNEKFRVNK